MKIQDVKAALREYHRAMGIVKSVPEMRGKIETAQMPCVMVRTAAGDWGHSDSGTLMQSRTFNIECVVEPLAQNKLSEVEDEVDALIQAFAEHYYKNLRIADGVWINAESISDNGIQVLDFGTQYIGFVFELSVSIRRITKCH